MALAAHGSPLDDPSLPGRSSYERCQSLIKRNAREAANAAAAWHEAGGGVASLHCEALALVALRRYAEAAAVLDRATLAEAVKNTELRVALYDQEGNAWLLAGEPQRAEAAINTALALSPRDEDILFDRARARAALKNWKGADADLSALLAIDSNRADALVLRASARHAEGRVADAKADITRALLVYPDYPEALVERGSMKYEAGDASGARADWQRVLSVAPNGEAARAAQERLTNLEPQTPKPVPK